MKQLNRENVGETRSPKELSVNLGGKVSHISAGVLHTCAVLDTGMNYISDLTIGRLSLTETFTTAQVQSFAGEMEKKAS
jgi:hypothetical protein